MNYKFNACTSLTSITLPDGVETIGVSAFGNHNMIVYFTSTTPCTQGGVGTAVKLAVPSSAVTTYQETWSELADVIVNLAHVEEDITVTAKERSSAVVEEIGDENLSSVLKLKVTGTFNSYDLMAFQIKMINLIELDLSDANVVGNSYCYNGNIYTKDNVITGKFAPRAIHVLKLPKNITSLEGEAFAYCYNIKSIDLPEGIAAIPYGAFQGCSSLSSIDIPNGVEIIEAKAFMGCRNLASINIPSTVTSIGEFAFASCGNITSIHLPEELQSLGSGAFHQCSSLKDILLPTHLTSINYVTFDGCSELTDIHLPSDLTSIGDYTFSGCSGLTAIHLPPYLTSIGDNAFSGCNNLKTIYAYMPDIIPIGTYTFNDYAHQQLYVPEFLYNSYYYDNNWRKFLRVNKRSLSPDDYDKVPTNSDIVFADGDERIPDNSDGTHVDGDINTEGSFTVEGDEPQPFDNVDQNLDGEGQGGSLIGEDDGEHEGNLIVNTLRVKINVKANRWYFFCFPYDVTIADCEYPGQYAWRYYDGAYRASNGSGGWKPVTGETLTANVGYAFQTSHTGNLIISFSHPSFGGNRPKTLVAHAAANAANASWNLVGNTYSSFYEFNENDISSPITVWNGNSYTAYRPCDDDFHLQPYEAFFVQKPSGTSSINFEAERRETYRQSEVKKAARVKAFRTKGINPQRRLINLEILDGEEQIDRTRVVLNQKASHAYEMECDAAKFFSTDADAQLYSVENGTQMAINERPQEGDIRLGYVAKKAGTLSISASRMDMPMVLVDTQLGTTFDLSLGTYDFDTAAGTFNNRFLLRPSGDATAINALTAQTGVCIGTQDGGIAIGGAEGKTIYVYAANGTLTAQHTGNGFIALKRGAYVVNVDGAGATVSVK